MGRAGRGETARGRTRGAIMTAPAGESQTSGVENEQTAQPDSRGAASSILLLLFLLQASVRDHQLEAACGTTWLFCDVPNLPLQQEEPP